MIVPVKYDEIRTTPFAAVLRSFSSIDDAMKLVNRKNYYNNNNNSSSSSSSNNNNNNNKNYNHSNMPKIIPKGIPRWKEQRPPPHKRQEYGVAISNGGITGRAIMNSVNNNNGKKRKRKTDISNGSSHYRIQRTDNIPFYNQRNGSGIKKARKK